MTARRRFAAPLGLALAVSLVACAPALPATVVPGTAVSVGWTGEFTSANAVAAPTSGNLDIAAMMRSGFGDLVDGEFVPDEGFGAVTIVGDDPFTVRYDLAEPAWSDGIPLDAADLLVGWAAASGFFDPAADGGAEAGTAPVMPEVDEFARAIEVTYPRPVEDWQQRIAAPVPAHVVGRLALGTDDAMEAKQAVITAIRDADDEALAAIAEVWNEGFGLPAEGGIPSDLLLSSGPFLVEEVSRDADGQRVTLVPNSAYRGLVTPQVETIRLVPPGQDPVPSVGERLDVVQVAPVTTNRQPIEAFERKDFTADTTHDGTAWTLLLRPSGVFAEQAARAAFLRAIPANAMVERGGGAWASAYTPSSSILAAPGTRAYDIALEDSGFATALTGADDPLLEREAAGVTSGVQVCVLHDRASEFAVGAFGALRDAAQEAGWSAVDCGTDDLAGALGQGGWDAVITRIPIPQTAAQISAQWGTGGSSSILGVSDPERDALIAQFAEATDVYAARDLRAQIEASIVRAAVALPLAVNPVVTVVDKAVTGVASRDGGEASLTSDAEQWAVVP